VHDEPRSPREQFTHLLTARVGPELTKIGFRRSGQTFRRLEGRNWLVIALQKSTYSSPEEVAFTVNLGVASALLAALEGRTERPPAAADCDLQERLGPLVTARRPRRTDRLGR
jgi:hypothetical protein